MYHSQIVLSIGGSVRYVVRNLRCTVTIDSVLANSKTQNTFLFTVHAIFRHDYPLAVEPASTPSTKKTLRDSLPIDMLLSAVSVLVVAQSSSEVLEGLMNNPVVPLRNLQPQNISMRHSQTKSLSQQYVLPLVHPTSNANLESDSRLTST